MNASACVADSSICSRVLVNSSVEAARGVLEGAVLEEQSPCPERLTGELELGGGALRLSGGHSRTDSRRISS